MLLFLCTFYRLLNYHVKIRPYNIIIGTRLFTLNTFINYYIKIANIDKIPANEVLTGLLLFWQ